MTPEQLAALQAAIAAALAPVTAQLTALETKVNTPQPPAPAPAPTPQPAPPAPAPAPAPQPQPPTPAPVSPELNAQLADYKRRQEQDAVRLEALENQNKEANERADQAERASVVDLALRDFQFADPNARTTAQNMILQNIKRTDAGLIAGDNLPVDAFVKDFLPKQHAYLLAPVGVPGSGTTANGGASYNAGGKRVDLDAIRYDMSPETRKAAYAEVAALVKTNL